jgi:hypothetical protein
MKEQKLTPNTKYLIKMFVSFSLIALLILIGGALLGFLIGLDKTRAGLITSGIIAASAILFWLISMPLAIPYYRSLKYEVLDDEVIVRAGILTHSVKHVPYRTVTNISVKRDILDRWFFNLGTLEIQTAGMSGQSGVEEKLVGLDNVEEVYELVAAQLRRYRGAMTPTAAEMVDEPTEQTGGASPELLEEVRQIRRLLEEQG